MAARGPGPCRRARAKTASKRVRWWLSSTTMVVLSAVSRRNSAALSARTRPSFVSRLIDESTTISPAPTLALATTTRPTSSSRVHGNRPPRASSSTRRERSRTSRRRTPTTPSTSTRAVDGAVSLRASQRRPMGSMRGRRRLRRAGWPSQPTMTRTPRVASSRRRLTSSALKADCSGGGTNTTVWAGSVTRSVRVAGSWLTLTTWPPACRARRNNNSPRGPPLLTLATGSLRPPLDVDCSSSVPSSSSTTAIDTAVIGRDGLIAVPVCRRGQRRPRRRGAARCARRRPRKRRRRS